MNRKEIISRFANHYIVKSKRDRAIHELTKKRGAFINRLNHNIPDLFKKATLIKISDFSERNIKNQLKVSSKASSYIISHDELDDSIMEFDVAFNQLFGSGLGFCIIPIHGEAIYLEAEQESGAPNRYICF